MKMLAAAAFKREPPEVPECESEGRGPQIPRGVTGSPRREPLKEARVRRSSGAAQDQHGTRFLGLRHEGEVFQEGRGWARWEVGEEKGQSLRIHGTES